ncbi:minor capsid protein [Oceanobacillus caeni]|uniref:minor capsid protein n=1 Tax=Oceanobacillus caeni TaxID=405946 RepID=UPI00214A3B2E|nr:minor capsid protein [Oceanobacillus caeni]MCR1833133.1 minor capsid protein [Oceanobacillus caeni]
MANLYPDDPDNIVAVIDLGGLPPNNYAATRDKKIEIKFRTKGYQEGIKLGEEIFNLFNDKQNYRLGDYYITTSYASTDVSYLYQDSKNRREFSLELAFQYIK